MKTLLGIFATVMFILGTQAHANVLQDLQHFIATQNTYPSLRSQLHFSEDAPPLKPIRQAYLKVQIQKTVYTQAPDGSYNSTETPVCTKESTLNVYDLRASDSGSVNLPPDDLSRVGCASTLNGQVVTVNVGGFVGLVTTSLFGDGKQDQLKAAVPVLWVANQSSNPGFQFASELLGTRDLNAQSMVTMVQPNVTTECSTDQSGNQTCQVSLGEYFSAVVDIQDHP